MRDYTDGLNKSLKLKEKTQKKLDSIFNQVDIDKYLKKKDDKKKKYFYLIFFLSFLIVGTGIALSF